MRIFGREPALWLAFIGSVLTVVVALNVPWLNAGQSAAVVSFLAAIFIAVMTRPVAPAVYTAVLSSGVALFAEYGLHASPAIVGALTGVILSFSTLVSRAQISPRETALSSK